MRFTATLSDTVASWIYLSLGKILLCHITTAHPALLFYFLCALH